MSRVKKLKKALSSLFSSLSRFLETVPPASGLIKNLAVFENPFYISFSLQSKEVISKFPTHLDFEIRIIGEFEKVVFQDLEYKKRRVEFSKVKVRLIFSNEHKGYALSNITELFLKRILIGFYEDEERKAGFVIPILPKRWKDRRVYDYLTADWFLTFYYNSYLFGKIFLILAEELEKNPPENKMFREVYSGIIDTIDELREICEILSVVGEKI